MSNLYNICQHNVPVTPKRSRGTYSEHIYDKRYIFKKL